MATVYKKSVFLARSILKILYLFSMKYHRLILVVVIFLWLYQPLRGSDIAFFYALEADLRSMETQAQIVGVPVNVCGRSIQRMNIGIHRVYAVKMNSGAVDTAVSATALLGHFRCDLAISLGPVGCLDDVLHVGDWRRIDKVVPYQKGSWSGERFQFNDTPTATKKGMRQPNVPRVEASPLINLENLEEQPAITVASGEAFIGSLVTRSQLRDQTKAQAVDMNLFGLIEACNSAGVPLWNWRVVSDRADEDAGRAFRAFVAGYDGSGGKAVAAIIRAIPANPDVPESHPDLQRLLETASPHP